MQPFLPATGAVMAAPMHGHGLLGAGTRDLAHLVGRDHHHRHHRAQRRHLPCRPRPRQFWNTPKWAAPPRVSSRGLISSRWRRMPSSRSSMQNTSCASGVVGVALPAAVVGGEGGEDLFAVVALVGVEPDEARRAPRPAAAGRRAARRRPAGRRRADRRRPVPGAGRQEQGPGAAAGRRSIAGRRRFAPRLEPQRQPFPGGSIGRARRIAVALDLSLDQVGQVFRQIPLLQGVTHHQLGRMAAEVVPQLGQAQRHAPAPLHQPARQTGAPAPGARRGSPSCRPAPRAGRHSRGAGAATGTCRTSRAAPAPDAPGRAPSAPRPGRGGSARASPHPARPAAVAPISRRRSGSSLSSQARSSRALPRQAA